MIRMSPSVESIACGRALSPPMLERTSSIFTVSIEDIFDYKRCPKIVAIKTYRRTQMDKKIP
ncbi:MAG TPA: hypothetical protein VGS11_07725 [Candidatus Bathyarchaeia archaeon]|nr:hypothetical protein [Candidatus Bathyarchaeia archaeon]